MKITSLQKEACRQLQNVLTNHQASKFKDSADLVLDRDACAEFDDNEMDDLADEEESEDLEESEQEIMEKLPPLVNNPLQQAILGLLISLFAHLPSGADDKFYSPISRFLVLYSLKKDGQWLAGRRITQLFSALLFCGREVMMALLHDAINQLPNIRYSE